MLSLSLFIALLLDRLLPALQNYRAGISISNYFSWVCKNWDFAALSRRLIPLLVLLPALLLVVFLVSLFQSAFYGMFSLGFFVIVAFICLEPRVLNEDVDTWIKDLEDGKPSSNLLAADLFGKANRGLYTVIFWLVAVGPVMAVAYRLLERLSTQQNLTAYSVWRKDVVRILAWLEWLPALLSGYIFMICGNFEAGLKMARSMPLLNSNVSTLNEERLRQVGVASVYGDNINDPQTSTETVRRTRGLLLRALLVWLGLSILLDYWI